MALTPEDFAAFNTQKRQRDRAAAQAAREGESPQAQQLDAINGVSPPPPAPADDKGMAKGEKVADSSKWIWNEIKNGIQANGSIPVGIVNWATNRILDAQAAYVENLTGLTPFGAPVKKAIDSTRREDGDFVPGLGATVRTGQNLIGVDQEMLQQQPGSLPAQVAGKVLGGMAMAPMALVAGPEAGTALKAGEIVATRGAPNVAKAASVTSLSNLAAEGGRAAAGGVARSLDASPEKVQDAENAAGIVAGIFGAPPGVVRYNVATKAATAAGKAVGSAPGDIRDAVVSAWKAKKADSSRSFTDVAMENFGLIRADRTGSIQRRTNQELANLLATNPDAKVNFDAIDSAVKQVTSESTANIMKTISENWSLGQRTADKTILDLEQVRKRTPAEAQVVNTVDRIRRGAVLDLFKTYLDGVMPVNRKAVQASIDAYGARTAEAMKVSEIAAIQAKRAIPNWTPTESAQAGAGMKTMIDDATKASENVNKANYQAAYQEAASKGGVPVGALSTVEEQLKKLTSKIDPAQVPAPLRRLDDILKGTGEPGAGIVVPGGTPAPKSFSLEDIHGVMKDLGSESATLRQKVGDPEAARTAYALEGVRKELEASVEKALGTDSAFAKAQERYRTQHAPTFGKGINVTADQSAGGVRLGLDKIPDEQMVFKVLDKNHIVENMDLFRKTFDGSQGIPANPKAFEALGQGLSAVFARDIVPVRGQLTPEKLDEFFRAYEPALNLVPGVRKQLETQATRIMTAQQSSANILERYNTSLNQPITKEIGPIAAVEFVSTMMADPTKLRHVLASPIGDSPKKAQAILGEVLRQGSPILADGVIDYGNFAKMMSFGVKKEGDPGSLRILAEAAYGKKVGDGFMDDLGAISEIFRRDALSDPRTRSMASPTLTEPIKSATGSSSATLLSDTKAFLQGRVGGVYMPVIASGRFINAKIQKHATKAMEEALYNPDMAKAVRVLMETPANQPVPKWAVDRVFKETANVVNQDLLERHLLADYAARGAAVGAGQVDTTKPKPKSEVNLSF